MCSRPDDLREYFKGAHFQNLITLKDGRRYIQKEVFDSVADADNGNTMLWLDDVDREIESVTALEVVE